MNCEYDRETDILTIVLQEERPDHGEQTENIITHYSANGKPVEIEILEASETMIELIRPMLGTNQEQARA